MKKSSYSTQSDTLNIKSTTGPITVDIEGNIISDEAPYGYAPLDADGNVDVPSLNTTLGCVKDLPQDPVANVLYMVAKFYQSNVDSQPVSMSFRYDPYRNKTDHDFPEIIAPESLLSFDGTHAGLSALYEYDASVHGGGQLDVIY